MITIDGSYGEGGGQILRTSLALSLVTGKPFTIHNIRAGRKKPGLMRQHLTALSAAAEIGNAEISGNAPGAQTFTFVPDTIVPGRYRFAIGSAGSCTLVFQTILPALMIADGPSEVILEGGTHNPFAPPFDFLTKAFLPVIETIGPRVEATLERPGFYPAGGGKIRIRITPSDKLRQVDLGIREKSVKRAATAMVANLPVSIALRELDVVRQKLSFDEDALHVLEMTHAAGPGNVLTIEIRSKQTTEVFTGFGEKGVSAERVAKECVKEAREYLGSAAVAGRYLADQLLIPMAMAGGGRFSTLSPSGHTRTNIEIIKHFLDVDIQVDTSETDPHLHYIEITS